MFVQTWRKYLPVITVLMKRQPGTEQVLAMNHTDFERAAGGRKVKFVFAELLLISGKPDLFTKLTPLAQDLVSLLQEDEMTKQLMQTKDFTFTLKSGFQLLIGIREKEAASVNNPEEAELSGQE